jgi:hypothetical protein
MVCVGDDAGAVVEFVMPVKQFAVILKLKVIAPHVDFNFFNEIMTFFAMITHSSILATFLIFMSPKPKFLLSTKNNSFLDFLNSRLN